MKFQLYAHLVAIVNGTLLTEQTGITIEDHVVHGCRVTIESALPEGGAEFDARGKLGEHVDVGVFLMVKHEVGAQILRIKGPISASTTHQPTDGTCARQTFTVVAEKMESA